MISEIIVEALTITCNYMYQNYSDKNYKILFNEILTIAGIDKFEFESDETIYSYEAVQKILSSLSEQIVLKLLSSNLISLFIKSRP